MENLETKPVENDDEISLIDLMAVLLKYKWMIIATVVFGMIAAVTISVISLKLPPEKSFLPNKYTSAGHMIINDSKSAGAEGYRQLADEVIERGIRDWYSVF